MEEHDGEEFAGFGEDEGEVVDVGEGGVAERGGEGLGDCDDEEGEEGGAGGEDGCGGGGGGGGGEEVEAAGDEGEEGLYGIEKDGKGEAFAGGGGVEGGGFGFEDRGGDALLEETPCQEGGVDAAYAYEELDDAAAGFCNVCDGLCSLCCHACGLGGVAVGVYRGFLCAFRQWLHDFAGVDALHGSDLFSARHNLSEDCAKGVDNSE